MRDPLAHIEELEATLAEWKGHARRWQARAKQRAVLQRATQDQLDRIETKLNQLIGELE